MLHRHSCPGWDMCCHVGPGWTGVLLHGQAETQDTHQPHQHHQAGESVLEGVQSGFVVVVVFFSVEGEYINACNDACTKV